MPHLASQEYLPNVAQRVSATIQLADQLNPTYGFFIEETLTSGAFARRFDKPEHHIVLQRLPRDIGLLSRRSYAHQRACLSSFIQGGLLH
jgi:hypothetical protein